MTLPRQDRNHFIKRMTSKTRRDGTKMIYIKAESSQDWSDWSIWKGNGPILVLMWCFCHSAPGWNYSSWHLAPLMKVNIGDTARTWNLVTFLNWEVGLTTIGLTFTYIRLEFQWRFSAFLKRAENQPAIFKEHIFARLNVTFTAYFLLCR